LQASLPCTRLDQAQIIVLQAAGAWGNWPEPCFLPWAVHSITGKVEHARGNGETERFGSLKINNQRKLHLAAERFNHSDAKSGFEVPVLPHF
jgi:hypothetical protein